MAFCLRPLWPVPPQNWQLAFKSNPFFSIPQHRNSIAQSFCTASAKRTVNPTAPTAPPTYRTLPMAPSTASTPAIRLVLLLLPAFGPCCFAPLLWPTPRPRVGRPRTTLAAFNLGGWGRWNWRGLGIEGFVQFGCFGLWHFPQIFSRR